MTKTALSTVSTGTTSSISTMVTTTMVLMPTYKPSVFSDDNRYDITITSGITLILLLGAIIFVAVIIILILYLKIKKLNRLVSMRNSQIATGFPQNMNTVFDMEKNDSYSFPAGIQLMDVSTSANEAYSVGIDTSRNRAYETITTIDTRVISDV